MALAIDASTPAVVENSAATSTTSTASFSPPAGSLLLLIATIDNGQTSTPTLALSGGSGLSWTQRISQPGPVGGGGQTVVWTAPNPSAQTGISITLTTSGTGSPWPLAMKLWVLTGADLTTPIAASTSGTFGVATNTTVSESLTNGAQANSLLFSAYDDYQCGSQNAATSSDLTVDAASTLGGASLEINYGFGHRTAAAASTSYSATWANNYTGGSSGSMAAVIVQPPAAASVIPQTRSPQRARLRRANTF